MDKGKNWFLPLFQGVIGNALYALLVLVWGGGVTYFAYVTPQWGSALLKGFFASVLLIVATVTLRIWSSMPSRRKPTTIGNIEQRATEWLFKYGLTIKNDPLDTAHFRLFVVTEGGAKIFIGRSKGKLEESVSFTADLKASADELHIAETMSPEEKLRVIYELQLEFSRAKIAYKGLDYIQGFSITKILPITSNLGETELLEALYEVEAVLNAALVVLRMAALRHRLKSEPKVRVIEAELDK